MLAFHFWLYHIKVAVNQHRHKSLILGRIKPIILELLAIEWRKFHTVELEYLWNQLASPDQILYVAPLGWGKGCIRCWGRLILAHWTQVSDCCPFGCLLFFLHEPWTAFFFWEKLWENFSRKSNIFLWEIRSCISPLNFKILPIKLHIFSLKFLCEISCFSWNFKVLLKAVSS